MPDNQNHHRKILATKTSIEQLFPEKCPPPTTPAPKDILTPPRKSLLFEIICNVIQPSSILEVGSWLGSSAIGWKQASITSNQSTKIFCIDTWLGSPEHFLNTHGEAWSKEKLLINERGPQIFDTFLSNIHNSGFEKSIIPMRADSKSALEYLKSKDAHFDVVYIDGAHDEISVFRDISLGFKVLNPNGILCGDDFGWPSVRTGLFLAMSDKSTPKSKVMFNGADFVVIPEKSKKLEALFQKNGFIKWRPLREQLSTLAKFCAKKVGWAIRKRIT